MNQITFADEDEALFSPIQESALTREVLNRKDAECGLENKESEQNKKRQRQETKPEVRRDRNRSTEFFHKIS